MLDFISNPKIHEKIRSLCIIDLFELIEISQNPISLLLISFKFLALLNNYIFKK